MLRYKYVPLDDSFKCANKRGSLSIIKDGTIKFTHPKDFNDPFDCHPEIDFSKSVSKDSLKRICNAARYSPAKRLQEKPKMISKLQRNDDRYIEEMNNTFAVCCLSRNPLNLLMWAHYASGHAGFVVEFSIPIKSTTSDDLCCLVPFPVEYKNDIPRTARLKEYALTKGLGIGNTSKKSV